MNQKLLLKEILKANFHKGGIKCLKLFKLDEIFFQKLRNEIFRYSNQFTPSDVSDPSHISHDVTKPYGQNFQYSLFNKSGRSDDFTTDWNKSYEGKKFHYASDFPTINELIGLLDGLVNMKLLVLGPHSGLFPHEAHVIVPRKKNIILRFHLPILANENCEMLLDNDYYKFEEQYIYFFNEGCIHSAYNHGNSFRFHLSWDMYFTTETYELMFNNSVTPDKLCRISEDESFISPHKYKVTTKYEMQGLGKKLYDAMLLKKLGIGERQFNMVFNNIMYLKYCLTRLK